MSALKETRQDRIDEILMNLNPTELFIEDESSQHSGNRVETHFKILIVSESFAGQSRLVRQQTIMGLLAGEFSLGLHAIQIRALTSEEYARGLGDNFTSPQCASRIAKK